MYLNTMGILMNGCEFQKVDQPLITDIDLTPVNQFNSWNDSIFLQVTYSILADDDHILIADYTGDRILQLDLSYQLVRQIGREGRGPEEIQGAMFVFLRDEVLYILDRANKRINSFHIDGTHRKVINLAGTPSMMGKFAVDEKGYIYISTNTEQYLYTKYDQNGKVVLTFGKPHIATPSYLPDYSDISHLRWFKNQVLLNRFP